jgi:flagellar motor switch protein FliG
MKYKRLTNDELEELETEFIRYLATYQITAQEWEKMKETEPQKVDELIETFSDLVYEKTLTNIEYLEYKTPNDIKTFHCQKDKIVMMGLMVEGDVTIDFTKQLASNEMSELIQKSNAQVNLYSAEKEYKGGREEELFRMLDWGCLISKDGHLYKTLVGLKTSK